jgi:hypothetical protein
MSDEDKAFQFGTPLDTQFDGALEADLALWAYVERNEEAHEKHCGLFEMTLKDALEGLQLDEQNRCF